MGLLWPRLFPFGKLSKLKSAAQGTNPKALTPGIDVWCRSHKIKDAEREKGWVSGFLGIKWPIHPPPPGSTLYSKLTPVRWEGVQDMKRQLQSLGK